MKLKSILVSPWLLESLVNKVAVLSARTRTTKVFGIERLQHEARWGQLL